ncbi:MAG: radical SAM protein [bacterium]|nr:radical SAM protein [bacterium]
MFTTLLLQAPRDAISVSPWLIWTLTIALSLLVVAFLIYVIVRAIKGKKSEPMEPGIFHLRYDRGDLDARLHLRVHPGGEGILMVNADRLLHLNQSGTEMTRYIINGREDGWIAKEMAGRYNAPKAKIRKDAVRLRETIDILASGDKRNPVTFLGIERVEPFTIEVSAPYRMDVALTYGCDNACPHCYNEKTREGETLSLDEFKRVIDKVWEVGIPHITFTGGEPTESPYLVELVEYAEEIGIITGLLTNGRKLADQAFVDKLADAGLDHVQITIESVDSAIHDDMVGVPGAFEQTVEGIKKIIASPMYLVTNTTLTKKNADGVEELVAFLAGLGVDHVAANGVIYSGEALDIDFSLTEIELQPIVTRMREACLEHSAKFTWYTPTEYCHFNPIELDLGAKQCTAAKYNMCVEPDGSVLPCQSYYESLGNILTDDWESIYNHDLANYIRNHEYVMDKCDGCPDLEICGAGCPLEVEGKKVVCCPDSASNA